MSEPCNDCWRRDRDLAEINELRLNYLRSLHEGRGFFKKEQEVRERFFKKLIGEIYVKPNKENTGVTLGGVVDGQNKD